MGNQPSSPHHSYSLHTAEGSDRSRRSRSRSRTSSVAAAANSSGHLKPHRSMRRKNKSIELPDLNGPIVPHARRAPAPLSQPIPINGGSAADRTGGNTDRDYAIHMPEELTARASANHNRTRDHTTERNDRRAGGRTDKRTQQPQVNHQQMANLLYQVQQAHTPPPVQVHPNPNEAYQAQPDHSPMPSPLNYSSEPRGGEMLHSRLRFGLEKHKLVKAGLMQGEDEDETSLAAETPQEVTVISPSEVAAGLVTPARDTLLDPLDESTSVEIKWTEGGQYVKLCLYSAAIAGFSISDVNGDVDEVEGTYAMKRSEDGTTFTKLLNLGPGTHHMRFLVSDATMVPPTDSDQPPSPLPPPSSFFSKLSKVLPTSPDPSGTLSNYVVVAPLKSPGVGVDGKLEIGAGSGAQVRPLVAVSVKRAVEELPTPQLKLPAVKRLQNEASNLARGGEPGQSFWSKDSEDQDSGSEDGPDEHEDEERRREREYEEMRRERERDKEKAGWTSEIPMELTAAAEQEEQFIEECKQRDEDANERKSGGTRVQTGFYTAPPIPQPPLIPRHLDKLILNHKPPASVPREGSPGGSGSPTRGGHRSRDGRESRRASRLHREEQQQELAKESRKAIIPVTTASGTDVTNTALLSTTMNAAAALTTASSFLTSASSAGGRFNKYMQNTPLGPIPQGSAIGGSVVTTLVTDDASVLPVPSHVVLNHLSTSAIRNGVIAVGGTVRYREKYLTTIYYKPT